MKSENPYTPPVNDPRPPKLPAEPEGGDPESYWVDGKFLHVRDGGTLPGICLWTGEQGSDCSRKTQAFRWQPGWVVFGFVLMLCGTTLILKASSFFILIPALLGVVVLEMWAKQVSISFCLSRNVFDQQKRPGFLPLFFVACIGGIVIGLILKFIWVPVLLVLVLMGVTHFIRERRLKFQIERVENGVITFARLHPRALRRLARWREENLPPR